MELESLEDLLYIADEYTGIWPYKAFLAAYYLVAFVVVRSVWRRTRTVAMGAPRRNAWLLLVAAVVSPCIVALGAAFVAPFPVGVYFYVGLAAEGYSKAALAEFLESIVVLLVIWLLLVASSALSYKSLERTGEG